MIESETKKLDNFLSTIRQARLPFQTGLDIALSFVAENEGKAEVIEDEGTTITTLICCGEVAYCFKPYDEIDLFYYEI